MTLVREYAQAGRRRNLSEGTIAKRTTELRLWVRSCPGWRTATGRDVERFVDGRHLGPNATASAVSHLHRFYIWAIRHEYCTTDPTVYVDRPKLPRRLPRPMRPTDVAVALEGADPQTRAAILLAALAGLRCCEVARLAWADVDLDRRVAVVTGKGNRDRVVGLPRRLVAALAALDGTDGPVLPGWQAPEGDRNPGRVVSQRVNRYLRSVGVTSTMHQLRHRYATDLYAATDHDLLAVQHALGHASVATTQVYAQADVSRAIAAAARLD